MRSWIGSIRSVIAGLCAWTGRRIATCQSLDLPTDPPVAELLIDREKDRTLRAVLVGMLREMERD